MLRYKINRIAKLTNRSYAAAQRRVEILAPAMVGNGPKEKLDAACEMILLKIEKQRHVFRNVDFSALYKDIICE